MQIPILNGVYTDNFADFRVGYPVNLQPVPLDSGISKGYLRPSDGIVKNGEGPGINRGGINWDGELYRVMGTKLVKVSSTGTVTTLGDVGGSGQCIFDYSFDRLAVASGGSLYYWNGAALTKVTDSDLGTVVDFCWVDGYFLSTDGQFLIVTELNNPTSVNPLKYGSSEVDPDPINSVMKLRNEIYAVNRYTIEVFDNIGGDFFPFQRIDGAQIQKGAIGTHASCVFDETIAFLGSGRNESPSIFQAVSGQIVKISTREIDELLQQYTESILSEVIFETRNGKDHSHLWVRLPDRTLVYDSRASKLVGEAVWFQLISGVDGFHKYLAKDVVWCYDRWNVGHSDTVEIGYLTDVISSQWGTLARWEFSTSIVYNEGQGAIFHELELVALTGRTAFGIDPYISTSYSNDGQTWSQEKSIKTGKTGDRNRRLVWFNQGAMRRWRIQRFRGDSQSFVSFARLEARLEPLAV